MGETGSVLLVRGPSTGGIRRHVAALAAALPACGWTVAILAVPGDPRAVPAVRRAAAGVDVVHAHGLRVGWWASLLPKRPPLVVTVHNVVLDEVAGWRAPLLRRLERRLPSRADAVIATSAAVAAGLGGRVAAVVAPFGPAPTPLRDPEAVRRAWPVPADAPVVITVGRLHPQKGLDGLLDAVPPLIARVPAVHVVVVGEGPLEAHLRRRIAAEGLSGRVHLVGPTTDAAAALAAADVVAVPSVWESGPLVVTEALERGRPVVATPVGFVPELIVDGETGRLVAPGDAAALAGALADVLEAPARAAAMAAAGQRRVAAWLDRDAAIASIVAVYEQVRRHR
jgi:glycosyltransferase involved in cell wall biosynthesis